MAIFKRKLKTGQQAVSTASLPDIIFMLLFFFMVATVMKEFTPEVKTVIPKAEQIDVLKQRDLIEFVYVGPKESAPDGPAHIQYKEDLLTVAQLGHRLDSAIKARPQTDQPKVTVSLTINGDTEMQLVDKIRAELRHINALKVLLETENEPKDQ